MLKVLLVVFLFAYIASLSYQKPMDGERPISPVAQDVSWSDLEDLFPLEEANSSMIPTVSNPLQNQEQSSFSDHSSSKRSPKDLNNERTQASKFFKNKQRRERYAKNKAENLDDHHVFIQQKYNRSKMRLANMTKEERETAKAKRNARAKINRQNRKGKTGFMTKRQQDISRLRGLVKNKEATEEQIEKLERMTIRKRRLKTNTPSSSTKRAKTNSR